MKFINLMSILIILSVAIGCGGSGSKGQEDQTSADNYAGIWYNATFDIYLEIKNDDEVYLRKCTVNDGYKIESAVSAFIVEDEMVWSDYGKISVFQMHLSTDLKTLNLVGALSYKKKSSIPSICVNDAISITFYSPTTAPEGQLTEFTINFDYRLVSSPEVEMRVCVSNLNTSILDGIEVENLICNIAPGANKLKIGTSSGSSGVGVAPEIFENSYTYYIGLGVYRSVNGKAGFVVMDSVPINVISN